MAENPSIDRYAAVAALTEAAGGKLVAMYGRSGNGPGVMVIFDVPDPEMAVAISGVAIASGSIQNAQLARLFSGEEMQSIRRKRARLSSSYKPPGEG